MKRKLPEAIIKTLIYSDIFDFPLRVSEIHQYLIKHHCLEKELSGLLYVNNPNHPEFTRIEAKEWQGYFYLGGQNRKWVVEQRIKREKIAKEKLKKAKELTAVLKWIPWIKMVAVTGRVAALNCEASDDIDLLIVTKKNRLWLSRFLEFLFLTSLRRRRRPKQNQGLKDKLCPNMYLSEGNLELLHKDLFTANELSRMKKVWERGEVYQQLLEANKWVGGYLPNWWKSEQEKIGDGRLKIDKEGRGWKTERGGGSNQGRSMFQSIFYLLASKINLSSSILNFLERLVRFLQLKYMQKHRTREIVENGLLMFHPQDVREKVLQEYQQRISLLKAVKGASLPWSAP